MKTKISALIVIMLMAIGVNAQIDRSKMPEPGPSPKISLEVPSEFELKNGIKVLVVENHKLPRVSYSLQIDNKPIAEGDKAGVSSILSAMLGNGTTSIPKDEFNDEIDFLGASLSFGSSSAFASGLTKYGDRILELMADAAINPLLTKEEFEKEKEKALEGIKTQEKSVDAAAGRVGRALSFGANHPLGEFETEETIKNIEFGDVLAFYDKYFNPNNAYIVVVGDVDYRDVKKKITANFGKWEKAAGIDYNIPNVTPNVQYTQINFVDMPNAVQSNISLMNNVDIKMNDEDYHAVLVANRILGGDFNSYLNMNLREEHGYTYGARSGVSMSRWGASRFTAGAAVRNAVTDSAVVETLKEINRIKTEPVDSKTLANVKAAYVGNFVLRLESPQTVANYALNIILNDLPKDFYTTYLEKLNAVTVEDVQRVANKYFKAENARIVVVGKGSEVIENLEKTGIPIMYFDKYANKTEKPVFSKPLPEGLTAKDVVNNYISAVGGKEKLEAVNTLILEMGASFQGQNMVTTLKQMTPNLMVNEVSMAAMGTVFKQAFDGEKGYMSQMGQKQDMPESMVTEMKTKKGLFDELSYVNDNPKMELTAIEPVEGKDAYVVVVESESGNKTTCYYDVETGLKIKQAQAAKGPGGQDITQETSYGDYKEVDGIKFPHKMVIPIAGMKVEFSTTSIQVNAPLTKKDFE